MESFIKQSIKEIRNNLKGKQWRINNHIPFMRYREVEIFSELLTNLRPMHVLEWGSGYSTLHFPALTPEHTKWTAVEHHKEWHEEIVGLNRNKNVEILLKEPNQFPYTDEHGDGAYEDFIDYVEAAGKEKKYDFILIDGRARNDCMTKAKEVLKPNGVVMLHDANRERYRRNLNLFQHQVIFLDYRRTAGGIWLGSNDKPIEEIITVKKHKNRWGMVQNKAAKILSI